MEKEDILRVLSLNTWMLRTPFGDIAKDIDDRIKLMPRAIAEEGPDVIVLQEVWNQTIRQRLIDHFRDLGFPYSVRGEAPANPQNLRARFGFTAVSALGLSGCQAMMTNGPHTFVAAASLASAGVAIGAAGIGASAIGWMRNQMGNGLLLISRYPVSPQADVLRFANITRPDECLVDKGAIRASVLVPKLGWIDVVNTHVGAVSFDARRKRYAARHTAARLKQAQTLARWIGKVRRHNFMVLAGDFNFHHREFSDQNYSDKPSAEYELFVGSELNLLDTCFGPGANLRGPNVTDSSENPYKESGHFKGSPDCALDYIFVSPHDRVAVRDAAIIFDKPLRADSGRSMHLSDHFGVMASLSIQ